MQQSPGEPLVLGPLCPSSPGGWLGEAGCALAEREPLTFLVIGLAAAGLVAFLYVRHRRRAEDARRPAFLVFPSSPGARRPAPPGAATRLSSAGPETRRPPRPGGATTHASSGGTQEGRPPRTGVASQRANAPSAAAREGRPSATDPGSSTDGERAPDRLPGSTWIESGPVRFEEPPEGTLQLLPGRLEIESGEGEPEEIRFVRVPGTEPEVTLGREEGPAYRHVQLRSPTVSRLHARLRFREGRWSVLNESSTNPTVLNGESLGSPDQVVALRDGDRLELGHVSFVFRQPDIRDRLSLRSSWYTDHGRRPSNQDATSVRTFPDGRELAVVCDGMGSSDAGGLASHEALGALVESLARGAGLTDAVRAANSAVVRRGGGEAGTAGMGTTMVALVREGDAYEIANVGDSRAYRIDRDGIRQITRDHSFVAEVVEGGRMSAEEAARSPWRNAITRHLGAEADVEVDLFGPFSAAESHLVVLCSDGIHSVMSDEQIEATAHAIPQIQDTARAIGEEALRRGSEDNVTVVVLEFGGGLSGR